MALQRRIALRLPSAHFDAHVSQRSSDVSNAYANVRRYIPVKARLLVLTASALVFAIIIASVQAATFAPAGSPYNGGDGAASCPPSGGLPAPSNPPALNTVTCTETGGASAVTVNWVSDTPSGSQTDNAWGQGTQSDCYF